MKNIVLYITEKKFLITKNTKVCCPKDKDELKKIVKERLRKDKNANLNDIDVSKITDMSELFYNLDPYNIDISEWDVSNVTNMMQMFDGCKNFNCDLREWDVSNVTNMDYMFTNCKKFNYDLSKWNITKAKYLTYAMFDGCKSLEDKPSWY